MKKIFQTAALLLLTGAYIPVQSQTNGLIAWYPFNGNANDESGNGNHGAVSGAVLTYDRNGNPNSAYDFNGASYVVVNNSASLMTITNAITISAWFNTINPHVNGSSGVIAGKMKTTGSRSYYLDCIDMANGGGDSIFFSLFDPGDHFYRSRIYSHFYDGKWHHIVCSYDSIPGDMKMYVDDSLLTTHYAGHFRFEQTTQPLTIGCYVGLSSGYRNYFNGKIDDVRIYDRALSHAEIDTLFNPVFSCKQYPDKAKIFTIYPNPANDFLNIDLTTEKPFSFQTEIITLTGSVIRTDHFIAPAGKQNFRIDISGLKEGVYFLKINSGGDIKLMKISVIR